MRLLLLTISFLSIINANAQFVFNNGADMSVNPGGVMIVKNGDLENNTGYLTVGGQLTVEGAFINQSLADGGNTTGEYIVAGNWVNNNTFTAHQSTVRLNGTSQLISGSSITSFYNLNLENSGTTKTQTIDAIVTNELTLDDVELATSDHKMTVTNTNTQAIVRNGNGFVSSTNNGRLVRNTASTGSYVFPTGWDDNGGVVYRPVAIAPSVDVPQEFSVRFVLEDPTNDGYDRNVKLPNVSDINDKYYHLAKQTSGNTQSSLSIFFDPQADGQWASIGRWQNKPHWEDIKAFSTSGAPLFEMRKTDWTSTNDEVHALISTKEIVNAYAFPNAFTPNGDSNNDFFGMIDQNGTAELLELRVFNRWGEMIFDKQRDNANDWNGSFKGKPQPNGTYSYTAVVKNLVTDEVDNVAGSIALIR
jgi:gliding motility-associated-like protein